MAIPQWMFLYYFYYYYYTPDLLLVFAFTSHISALA